MTGSARPLEEAEIDDPILTAGAPVRVRLVKGGKPDLVYDMTVIADDGDHLIVEGPFAGSEARDLGYVRFDLDDWFVEHFWRRRWYSIKAVRTADGRPKGWYCDIARPATIRPGHVRSVDLELDLWVPADGGDPLVLDAAEFAAAGLERSDPAAARAARTALAELRDAASGQLAGILGTAHGGTR